MLGSIILAAGMGTRMKSKLPKVLHNVAGQPLVSHVANVVSQIGSSKNIIVIGYGADQVREKLEGSFKFVTQKEQLGTGHAVMQAKKEVIGKIDVVVVISGDTPLLTEKTLERLYKYHSISGAVATVLSTNMPDPTNYGRIIRNSENKIVKIVEEKDASFEEKKITEINTGVYCFNSKKLFEALAAVVPKNNQSEYYLTDVIEILLNKHLKVEVVVTDDYLEVMGINNRVQLAEAEAILRKRISQKQMLAGVTIVNPDATYIDASVKIGIDSIIYPSCYLEGKTEIGEGCIIGPDCSLKDTVVGNKTTIIRSTAVEAVIGDDCKIGPYSYLRPGTCLGASVKIGDFVEIKKSTIGTGSKIPHLSYIGDCEMGEHVNVGAGTITCNYDGKNKFKTILEDGSFIGSNANLVAPIKIGKNAFVAAGSTITKGVPAETLAIERGIQKNIPGWSKKRKESNKI